MLVSERCAYHEGTLEEPEKQQGGGGKGRRSKGCRLWRERASTREWSKLPRAHQQQNLAPVELVKGDSTVM